MIALLTAHHDLIITTICVALGAGMTALVVFTRPGSARPLVVYVERTVSGIRYHRAGGRHAKTEPEAAPQPMTDTAPMPTAPDLRHA